MNQKEPSTVCVPLHQTHQTSSTNKPFVFFFKCCFLWATFQCPSVALCDHCCTLVVFDCLLKMKWKDWVSLQPCKVGRPQARLQRFTVHHANVCLISLQRKEKRNCRRSQRGQPGCSCCAWRLNVGGGQWWNFVVGCRL